jgi:hypothetical protein
MHLTLKGCNHAVVIIQVLIDQVGNNTLAYLYGATEQIKKLYNLDRIQDEVKAACTEESHFLESIL